MLLFKTLLALHVATGTIGLVTLWVPLIGRKGGAAHKRWGRVFAYAIMATASLAVAMSLLTLADPRGTHPKIDDTALIRCLFGWLMLHLSVFTVLLAWFGLSTVRRRRDHRAHRNPVLIGLQAATLATGIACAYFGWREGFPLMIGIVPLGVATVALQARFVMADRPGPNDWQIQHMRALVGAGVSVYTAFFAFGAANLLPAIAFNPVLWAAPTLLGCAVIAYHQSRIAAMPAARQARVGLNSPEHARPARARQT